MRERMASASFETPVIKKKFGHRFGPVSPLPETICETTQLPEAERCTYKGWHSSHLILRPNPSSIMHRHRRSWFELRDDSLARRLAQGRELGEVQPSDSVLTTRHKQLRAARPRMPTMPRRPNRRRRGPSLSPSAPIRRRRPPTGLVPDQNVTRPALACHAEMG